MGNSIPSTQRKQAFTLIELLVVIAIIGILVSMLLPALSRAKEKAKVAKVRGELYCVGVALQMYSDDNAGNLPPTRTSCNSDMSDHWFQFPVELAAGGYLPHGNKKGMAACMEDVFNPGHTYKYLAPGPSIQNDAKKPNGEQSIWVPYDFPVCNDPEGTNYFDLKTSPVRWVIWSLGPLPNSPENQADHAPISSKSWHKRVGQGGVIPRMADSNEIQFNRP